MHLLQQDHSNHRCSHPPHPPAQLSALRLMPETGKQVMKKVLYESREKALAKQNGATAVSTAKAAAPAGVQVSAVSGGTAAASARHRK